MLKTIEIINTDKIQINIKVNDTMMLFTIPSNEGEWDNIASLTCYYSSNVLNITDLYVKHEYRNQLYGSKLLEQAILVAKERKYESIILDDCSDRFKLPHNIYIKFGFTYIDNNFPEMIYIL